MICPAMCTALQQQINSTQNGQQ